MNEKIKPLLVTLSIEFLRLYENQQVFNSAGFKVYSKIVTLLDGYISQSNSTYFKEIRSQLPFMTPEDFQNYYAIVSAELNKQKNIFHFFISLFSTSSSMVSETEEKFQEILESLKRIISVSKNQELEEAWNQSFEV